MGIRTLIVFLAIIGVAWLIRRSWRQITSVKQAPPEQVAQMVRCVRCGLHVPRDEAYYDANELGYCNREHRDLGPRKDPE